MAAATGAITPGRSARRRANRSPRTPIEQEVSLRDERVIVERRPASGTVATDAAALLKREFKSVQAPTG
jgi:hypothetical protein